MIIPCCYPLLSYHACDCYSKFVFNSCMREVLSMYIFYLLLVCMSFQIR